MIKTIIFCSLTIQFSILNMELGNTSATSFREFSNEQWQLIKDAICRHISHIEDEAYENKLETLFPEIKTPRDRPPFIHFDEENTDKTKKKTKNRYRDCPLCGKSVSKISVHLRYHKDEYNYPCDQ